MLPRYLGICIYSGSHKEMFLYGMFIPGTCILLSYAYCGGGLVWVVGWFVEFGWWVEEISLLFSWARVDCFFFFLVTIYVGWEVEEINYLFTWVSTNLFFRRRFVGWGWMKSINYWLGLAWMFNSFVLETIRRSLKVFLVYSIHKLFYGWREGRSYFWGAVYSLVFLLVASI